MTRTTLVALAILLGACSRNPDPEYAPATESSSAEPAAAPAPAPVAAPAVEAPAAPAATPLVAEDRAMALGREAVALLKENRVPELWARFDAQMQAALGSPEAFSQMIAGMSQQLGPEVEVVDEIIGVPDEAPQLTYYRRRAKYLLMSDMNLDMYVVFNADESIAGLTARPAEE